MPDRSFLDWPFFEPPATARLADELDAWATANLARPTTPTPTPPAARWSRSARAAG